MRTVARDALPFSRLRSDPPALIAAALDLFGAKASRRPRPAPIAAAAGANLASIAYHFGGKQGLRLACADHVVETIRGALGPALAAALDAADAGGGARSARARRRGDRRLPGRRRRRRRSPASSCARCSSRPKLSSASTPKRSRRCTQRLPLWAAATGAPPRAPNPPRRIRDDRPDALFPHRSRPVLLRMGWTRHRPE